MEVAGQWRREWAGTAEYGKVTSGGVTRQVARAMEVLHASSGGSRVRVLRAAYHATTGSGAPAQSFMMHSSRRVISSGSSFMDPSAFLTKPLEIASKPFEISSTPLESSPERFSESENYKVTEPDDTEISEPSKWRSPTSTNGRMPSEESSSTADNFSVIDLDTRVNKHSSLLRKYSFDSDSSEIQSKQSPKRNSTRASPLLDPPVSLSTLKYKSLLNGNNDSWNDRRKSYSFEDTSPLSETIQHKNDTLAMESSTDSGICKSTEVVNEPTDERTHHIHVDTSDGSYEPREGSFRDWLARNRQYKETPVKTHRDNCIIEEPSEDKITLQSAGKVSIALPMNNQIDDKYQYMKTHINNEERRVKRVEFCKTELHFAADSGKVNIIATDEKPPPTNDFRRRRSAFVPIKSNFDKPVTLFGERINDFTPINDFESNLNGDPGESDENTAATKSILKNKIPKPKPYLLGENMVFGKNDAYENGRTLIENVVPTAVSLINKQLQPEDKKYVPTMINNEQNDTKAKNEGSSFHIKEEMSENQYFQRFKSERNSFRDDFKKFHDVAIESNNTRSIKEKLRNFQTSPVIQVKPKARKLRENELTYFGVGNNKSNNEQRESLQDSIMRVYNKTRETHSDNDLQSVKLIQRVSNSVCNSEAESDDTPEYQNLPIKNSHAPIPVPRPRTRVLSDYKTDRYADDDSERVVILKPIVEQSYVVQDNTIERESRRSRQRRHDATATSKNRSISEPPKQKTIVAAYDRPNRDSRRPYNDVSKSKSKRYGEKYTEEVQEPLHCEEQNLPEEEALYVNVNGESEPEVKRVNSPKNSPELQDHSRDRHRWKSSTDRHEKSHRKLENETIQEDPNRGSIKSRSSKHTNSIDQHTESSRRKIEKSSTRSRKDNTSVSRDRKRSEIVLPTNEPDVIELRIAEKSPNKESRHYTHRERTHQLDTIEKLKDNKHGSYGRSSSKGIDTVDERTNSKRRERSKSRDKSERHLDNTKAADYNTQNKHTKRIEDRDSTVKSDKNKRREYVINYDDKNGTVSSICKLKPGAKRMSTHPEKIKEMQYQEPLWIPSESRLDRKWKTKVYSQRNCQLL
ncbi:hypothetical protein JYU34_007410 [Plutella xylostella]|uniref:Uncharacterized protein n=1 Tax=Plutella xylostella TaxID=51655 RepID=A0ABQ7QQC8_PLUXY|nr:hypothetical protein JYU34_007410 [Plutella xylostella]